MTTRDVPLPGLEAIEIEPGHLVASHGGLTPLEVAARRSLAALDAAGVLTEAHALPMALVLDLSRAVAVGTRTGKASAAAMAAAQLREAFAMLPDLPAGTAEDDPWTLLVAELRKAGAAVPASGPPPQVLQ